VVKTVLKYLVVIFVGTVGLYRLAGDGGEGKAPPLEEPAPPADVRASSSEDGVVLTWDPPADDGGGNVVGYRIVALTAAKAVVDSASTTPTARSYTVPDPVASEIHTLTVQSVGNGGAVSREVALEWGAAERDRSRR
jgi:hypothetical protein